MRDPLESGFGELIQISARQIAFQEYALKQDPFRVNRSDGKYFTGRKTGFGP
jgi:hypothetical protein